MRNALQTDVPCVRCFYNLRGLSPDGACPECGNPIGPSLDPTRLVFADPRWLRDVTRAIELLYRALPALAIVLVLLAVAFWPYVWTGQGAGVVIFRALFSIAVTLGALAVVVGCLRMTAREPAASVAAAPVVGLWLARVGAVAGGATTVAMLLLPRFGVRLSTERFSLVLLLIFVSMCIAAIGLLGRLRRLAVRLPDPLLARGLRRDVVIIAVAGAVIAVKSHVPLPTGGRPAGLLLMAAAILCGGVWDYLRRFRHAQRRLAPPPLSADEGRQLAE